MLPSLSMETLRSNAPHCDSSFIGEESEPTPRQVRETLRMICAARGGRFSASPTVGPQEPWAGARNLASGAALPTTPGVTLSKSLPSPSSFYWKNRGNGDWTTLPAS